MEFYELLIACVVVPFSMIAAIVAFSERSGKMWSVTIDLDGRLLQCVATERHREALDGGFSWRCVEHTYLVHNGAHVERWRIYITVRASSYQNAVYRAREVERFARVQKLRANIEG